MPKPSIAALSGSIRAGSLNNGILETLKEIVADRADIRIHSLRGLPAYDQDEDTASPPQAVNELRRAIAGADAMVIASPEYNHGMPGVLKNALDWASRPYGKAALIGKPVLVITSSPGALGGVRAHAQLNDTLLSTASRIVLRPQAVIPFVQDKMRDGRLVDAAALDFIVSGVEDLIRDIATPAAVQIEQS